jgi:hypothetical protein
MSVRYFSAEVETKPEAEAAPVQPPTKEELEQGNKEWGIKYNDECLQFEKEWALIARNVEDE